MRLREEEVEEEEDAEERKDSKEKKSAKEKKKSLKLETEDTKQESVILRHRGVKEGGGGEGKRLQEDMEDT